MLYGVVPCCLGALLCYRVLYCDLWCNVIFLYCFIVLRSAQYSFLCFLDVAICGRWVALFKFIVLCSVCFMKIVWCLVVSCLASYCQFLLLYFCVVFYYALLSVVVFSGVLSCFVV